MQNRKTFLPQCSPYFQPPSIAVPSSGKKYLLPQASSPKFLPLSYPHQLLDLCNITPISTTQTKPNLLKVKLFPSDSLKSESSLQPLQSISKFVKKLKSNNSKLSKSNVNIPRQTTTHTTDGSIILDSSQTMQITKPSFYKKKVFFHQHSKEKSADSIRRTSLKLCPTSYSPSKSPNDSIPTLKSIDEHQESKPFKLKPLTDQQRIATRAALKHFRSIESIEAVQVLKKNQISPFRGTRQNFNSHEVTTMLKERIAVMLRNKKQALGARYSSSMKLRPRLNPIGRIVNESRQETL